MSKIPLHYFRMREFWLGYIFYHSINKEWSDFEQYTHSGYFPELKNNPISFKVTNEVGIILRIGKLLPLAELRVFDSSHPEGIRIGYYDDGHPVNFLFKWDEMVKISGILAEQIPECPTAPFILLSIFAPPTIEDDWEKVKETISFNWKSLGIFPEEFIDEEIVEMYKPFDDTYKFMYHPGFGWYCEGNYVNTLRHPNNSTFPTELFNKLISGIN